MTRDATPTAFEEAVARKLYASNPEYDMVLRKRVSWKDAPQSRRDQEIALARSILPEMVKVREALSRCTRPVVILSSETTREQDFENLCRELSEHQREAYAALQSLESEGGE
jgi:hypothetical protein